jgi:hypothetical protein
MICLVWYGMVWYGMVWYGMVWYGMVWYGMVWYSKVLPSYLRFRSSYDVTRHQHGGEQSSHAIRYGKV